MSGSFVGAQSVIQSLVQVLPFDLDEESMANYAIDAVAMKDLIEEFYQPKEGKESIGHKVDDEFNSFLEVYEEPRQEVKDGILDGLTFAVKDNIAAEGLTMTCGLKVVVDDNFFHGREDRWSSLHGKELTGLPTHVFKDGELAVKHEQLLVDKGIGEYLPQHEG